MTNWLKRQVVAAFRRRDIVLVKVPAYEDDQARLHALESEMARLRGQLRSEQSSARVREEQIREAVRNRLKSEKKYFNICSTGRTATHWIAKVLSAHPDMVCIHGPESCPYGDGEEAEFQRTERHHKEASAVTSMNIDDYYDMLEQRRFKVYGVVHGISGVGPFFEPWNYRRYYFVAQVTREPMTRIMSFARRWLDEARAIEGRSETLYAAAMGHHASCLALGAKLPNLSEMITEERAFVSAAYWCLSNELLNAPIPVFRTEDITSRRDDFAAFFEAVTQGGIKPSEAYVEKALQEPSIDVRQTQRRDPRSIYMELTGWQRSLLVALLDHFQLRDAYERLGYDLSFVR